MREAQPPGRTLLPSSAMQRAPRCVLQAAGGSSAPLPHEAVLPNARRTPCARIGRRGRCFEKRLLGQPVVRQTPSGDSCDAPRS